LNYEPLSIIPVIDLLRGHAVHARRGRRAEYLPIATALDVDISGDAIALARLYVERLGLQDVYVADLDAIQGGTPQDALVASIAQLGADVWVDAGITSVAHARQVLGTGPSRVIVGLETLHSFEQLDEICSDAGGERVAFSLDLRDGKPVFAAGAGGGAGPGEPAYIVAARAAHSGAGAVIVLDLARVGTGAGLDLALIARVRETTPGLTLVAGGGIGGLEDLVRLADSGCDGALVATALHDGRLGAAEVTAARRLAGHRSPTL